MTRPTTPLRGLVAGLAALDGVTVRGQELSGPYLSTLLSVNPEDPTNESARTPQLISDLARYVAAAAKDLEMAQIDERVWRYEFVCEVTLGPDAAETAANHGFGDGNKPMSKTAAEGAAHTLPEYRAHMKRIADLREVLKTVEGAYAAAEARSKVVYDYHRNGGTVDTSSAVDSGPEETYNGRTISDPLTEYDNPSPAEVESAAVAAPRTPLPPTPAPVGPPPPPAVRSDA